MRHVCEVSNSCVYGMGLGVWTSSKIRQRPADPLEIEIIIGFLRNIYLNYQVH